MDHNEEPDLASVLRDTPWSAIVVPLILALVVVVVFFILVLRS